ncbi:hypothetical protein H310_10900 [Aphanomyces invadans]|uniref:Crossover junction endonuclease MUS81-like HHH domain-containing protein n=1 Tax=Aphanomyces invadans TaxID=157072 RepID=A0A024TPC2_9STRA|nr:hypothetical protein H310_10900 [Aphanomyces invadans]ETV95858.1 hypothetical protein H310_10900 [Aphanomyces invadans]RHY29116.1 hypothetical protein DYB32_005409 [Aphanomyces invadans]|eukprot:XP_008875609.1 hypothetical protein H310_10900 [Aphanomyces invadans]
MSNKAAAKKAAQELLELCKKDGVHLPTDAMNAMIQAGTMLNATRADGEYNLTAALAAMVEKFGATKPEPETKKRKASGGKKSTKGSDESVKDEAQDASDGGEASPVAKKKKSVAQATNTKNQALAEAFSDLAGFEFKKGDRFKGGSYSKVAKAIRDAEDALTSGKQAMKLKGVGKASATKIDEFLETGKIEKLEEYRAGNM